MSAYVVEDKTINRIVNYLAKNWHIIARQKLKEAGYDLEKIEGQIRLAQEMFDLNCESVNQRYEDRPARTEFHSEPFMFQKTDLITDVQAFKSLSCWSYQSCEGNCNEHSLYKLMQEIEGDIARHIVYSLKEFDIAVWG